MKLLYSLIFLQIGLAEISDIQPKSQQNLGFVDTLRNLFDGENGFNYEQLKNAAINFMGSSNSTVVQGLRNMVLGQNTDSQMSEKVDSVKEGLSDKGKFALEEIMRFLGDTKNTDSFVHEMIRRISGQQSTEDQSLLTRLFQGK